MYYFTQVWLKNRVQTLEKVYQSQAFYTIH